MSTTVHESSSADVARIEPGSPESFVQVSTSNPASDEIPKFDSAFELLSAMAHRHDDIDDPNAPRDVPNFKPKSVHGIAVLRFLEAALDSARARDVTNPAFHKHLNAALEVLNERRNEHGARPTAPASISLRGAVTRTMFIVAQTGMEEEGLRNALLKLLNTEGRKVYVKGPDGNIRVLPMLTCLHVVAPSNLDPGEFEATALHEFNSAFNRLNTAHSLGVTNPGPLANHGRALRSLVIAGSVVCMVVTGITAADARAGRAKQFVKMLATLAKTTGVAMLILCSTGAFADLARSTAEIKWLTKLGVHEVRPEAADSLYWQDACTDAWARYLARSFGADAPEWFATRMWEATRGLDDLRTMLCLVIEANSAKKTGLTLTEAAFQKHAKKALLTDEPYLRAMKAAENKNCSPTMWKHNADFLPMDWNIQGLKAEDDVADVITPPEDDHAEEKQA